MDSLLDESYWNQRYQSGATGWDIGSPSPPLRAYADQLTDKHIRILVPGCGNGYEVEYLLRQGFTQVTVVDISSTLTARLEKRLAQWAGKELQVVHADFFDLTGQFDLVLEQTFFCALNPSLREKYARHMKSLLAPGGRLAGVWFNRDFEGGPPFGGNAEEYTQLFAPLFRIAKMAPCYNSIPQREGNELFLVLEA